ncbi:MAG: ferritin [Puniceicoccaceae bacterium 5H]|nr:MAG: ferritin [Puniceicoccaceae bacterium 5H]
MKPEVKTALNEQYLHELGAAHAYRALACWCAFNSYNGFAEFFNKQSEEELEHAEMFSDYLLDRGEMPEVGALPAPRTEFQNLTAVAEQAGIMERANSKGIDECYRIALEVADYATQVFLHDLISEQVEEEAWCATMLDKVKQATCAGALLTLDRHIVKELAEE